MPYNRHTPVDDIAVERLINGAPPPTTTAAEKREAIRVLTRRHMPAAAIAERIGVTPRTVQRHRAALRDPA
jgi:DNA-binding CsgD family transcriptional regulator